MLIVLLCIILFLIFLAIFNDFLPKFFCNIGWHKAPLEIYNRNNLEGRCPRCNKFVLQDSQGNWFSVE